MTARSCMGVLIFGLVVVSTLASCSSSSSTPGGSSGSSGTTQPPTTTATGPSGGTVTSNGASVEIPAGALAAEASIGVGVATRSDAPAFPAGITAAGSVFAFTPHGQTFAKPVTIKIPFTAPASGTPRLYTSSPGGTWSVVEGATATGGVFTATVTHFSFFGAGASATSGDSDTNDTDCTHLSGSCAPGQPGCCQTISAASQCTVATYTCCITITGKCSQPSDCCGGSFFSCGKSGRCCGLENASCSLPEQCCSGDCLAGRCTK